MVMAPKWWIGAASALTILAFTASGCGGTHTAASARGSTTTSITAGATTSAPSTLPAVSTPLSTSPPVPGSASTRVPATTLPGGGHQTVSATATDLDVTMSVTPLRGPAGTSVGFSVTANATDATGALGYQLSYGDHTTDQNAVAQFCTSGNGSVSNGAWSFSHRYAAAGTYPASVRVFVNCSSHEVTTATVTITIS